MPGPARRRSRRSALILSTDGTAVGGVTRVTLSLASQLGKSGWTVTPVYPGSTDNPEMLRRWAGEYGVEPEISRDWLSANGGRLRSTVALWRTVRAARAGVVNLHYGGSHIPLKDVLAVRSAGARRCVVALHAPNPWSEAGRSRRWMTRVASVGCSAIVPCSESVASVLREAGVSERRMAVVHGGVRTPGTTPGRAEARAALNLPADAFVVASVIRMSPEKAVPNLVQAVGSLADPDSNLRLVIKGDDGPDLGAVEALASELLPGRCTILPAGADNEMVYAAADLFVLPSLLEGFPLVLMEAAVRGLPAVATDVGSVAELVVDGNTGVIVPPGDVGALADAIQLLWCDTALRCQMAGEARTHAQAEFGEELMAQRYEAVFEG